MSVTRDVRTLPLREKLLLKLRRLTAIRRLEIEVSAALLKDLGDLRPGLEVLTEPLAGHLAHRLLRIDLSQLVRRQLNLAGLVQDRQIATEEEADRGALRRE